MIEIFPNLFIGNETDYETKVRYESGWCIVHACKEPYHRQALGYSSRAAPQNHPEYLIAKRGNRLILNLVDAPNPDYIPKEIIDAALDFIYSSLKSGNKVLVHCNEGRSRSPCIGLLYLAQNTDRLPRNNFIDAENVFRSIYPTYYPKTGMRGFMRINWVSYVKPHEEIPK